MPSVAEELAALRKQSLTKNHAAKLQDVNGLSTPEQEASALKESKNKTRTAAYSKDAVETLNAGSKAVDQDLDFKVQQIARKKEDKKKQREADQRNKAGTKAVDKQLDFEVQQINKKKEDLEKKREATKNLQGFNEAKLASVDKPQVGKATTTTNSPEATKTDSVEAAAKPTDEPKVAPKMNTEETTEPETSNAPDIEEIPELDEVPQLETVTENGDVTLGDSSLPQSTMSPAIQAPRVQSRSEKKARKVMERVGMRQINGISRVTLKMRGNKGYFTIFQPDVFEKSGSYIVFGEAKQGSGFPRPQEQQMQAVQQLETPVVEEKKLDDIETSEEVIDETGVDSKDIDLVISQAGCTRARAVAALKENDGDLVNAIMSLTA